MHPLPTLSTRELTADAEVRWCPGCGDYSILAQLKKALVQGGVPREKLVFVSGVGCASRLPYYLDTYGFQTIAGRAPAIATGIKLANPDLQVWVVTGDGDGLAAGGNHLLHLLRRNVDVKVLLLNNETGGLGGGHASPTSRPGTRSMSSETGSSDPPLRPLALALAAGATFVARAIDVDVANLSAVLQRAAAHRGTAFVEIYQNCKVFNDDVWAYATDRSMKSDHLMQIVHGQPMVFGRDRDRGIRLQGLHPAIVEIDSGRRVDDLLVHDETDEAVAALLSRMSSPEFPEPVGVLRAVRRPAFGDQFSRGAAAGQGTLADLFAGR